jgi:hypothetical protein
MGWPFCQRPEVQQIGIVKQVVCLPLNIQVLTSWDRHPQFAPPVELLKIQSKYDLLRNLNGLPSVSIDKHYDDLTKLRNKIIHYTFSGKDKVYSDTILDSVRNARDVVRTFILDLYSIVQEQPPTWVNFTSSRDIQ